MHSMRDLEIVVKEEPRVKSRPSYYSGLFFTRGACVARLSRGGGLGGGGAVGLGAFGLGLGGLGGRHLDAGEARDAFLVDPDAQGARVGQGGDLLLGDRVARVDRGGSGGLAVVPDVDVLEGTGQASVDDVLELVGELQSFTLGVEAHHQSPHPGVLVLLELQPDASQDVALTPQIADDLVQAHAVVRGTFFTRAEQGGAIVAHRVACAVGTTTEALTMILAERLVALRLDGLELLARLALDVYASGDEALVPGLVRADVQQNRDGWGLGGGGWIAHGELLL